MIFTKKKKKHKRNQKSGSWEIEGDKVMIKNPNWDKSLIKLKERLKSFFGMEAELKLEKIVFEGSNGNQEGYENEEKVKLVIQLPSEFKTQEEHSKFSVENQNFLQIKKNHYLFPYQCFYLFYYSLLQFPCIKVIRDFFFFSST